MYVAGRAGIWQMRLSSSTRGKSGRTHPTTGDVVGATGADLRMRSENLSET